MNNSRAISAAACRAGIPVRIGSLFRLYNLRRFTHLVATSRAYLGRNKRQLDLEYLLPLGTHVQDLEEVAGLYRPTTTASPLMAALHPQRLAGGRHATILSPALTTARAHQWPLASYSALIGSLDPERLHWLICGLESERAQLLALLEAHAPNVTDTVGKLALRDCMACVASCDGLIAGSTGPLHLAAALGIHALGLFQSRRSDVNRWRPVGPAAAVLHSDVRCEGERRNRHGRALPCPCIHAIQPDAVAHCVLAWFRSEPHTGAWPISRDGTAALPESPWSTPQGAARPDHNAAGVPLKTAVTGVRASSLPRAPRSGNAIESGRSAPTRTAIA